MDEMTQYSQVRNDEVIGGATGDAQHILYTPAEQGRARTNVNAELDRINTHLLDWKELGTGNSCDISASNIHEVLCIATYTSGSATLSYSLTIPKVSGASSKRFFDGFSSNANNGNYVQFATNAALTSINLQQFYVDGLNVFNTANVSVAYYYR